MERIEIARDARDSTAALVRRGVAKADFERALCALRSVLGMGGNIGEVKVHDVELAAPTSTPSARSPER